MDNYIDNCINSNNHYDVSKVIYELIKDKFDYLGNDKWYYKNTDDDNNNDNNDKINLINEIKSNVVNNFLIRCRYWDDLSNKEIDKDKINLYQIKSLALLKIANKLKNDIYIKSIIKELKQFF